MLESFVITFVVALIPLAMAVVVAFMAVLLAFVELWAWGFAKLTAEPEPEPEPASPTLDEPVIIHDILPPNFQGQA